MGMDETTRSVICDGCQREYRDSDETGGIVIGRDAYGPCCGAWEKRQVGQIGRLDWEGIIECPPRMSFRQWIVSRRG